MKKRVYLVFAAIFLSFNIKAQDLKGSIRNEEEDPVIGAYIIHLSSDHHAHTNELGFFLLKDVRQGDSIKITNVGYKTKVLAIENLNEPLNIVLEENIFQIEEIIVTQEINSLNQVTEIDLQTNPVVNSSQEILRRVPGLFIGQHAGGGKAEQIFLRGFDIDHGTDVNLTVDGMPVNMVSHAHGQGYADLHFLIPETIQQIDFGKGPYNASKGNFTTAGYVGLNTRDRLDESQIKLEVGRFNTLRALGMFDLISSDKHNLYLATEYLLTDGPFESSQEFNRFNIMGKYVGDFSSKDRVTIALSHFASKWDASGQIPQRAVDAGLISRFGAIDDTEGGNTSRSNVNIAYRRVIDEQTFIKNRFFYSYYDFELFSNFTFFLEDPVNGDQIVQQEEREIFGFESQLNHFFYVNNSEFLLQVGAGLRYDDINNNRLARTQNRKTTLEEIQFGDVDESNFYAYASLEIEAGKWLINPGLRLDYLNFNYVDNLQVQYETQAQSKAILSPKLNIAFNANENLQLFLKGGVGFHSNDTRVVVAQSGEEILPAAFGSDIGFIWKPVPKLYLNVAYWYLFLEQEFVYVGDAGIVEPSGQTRRTGIDVGLRYQLTNWLFFDGDVNYAYARSIDEPEGSQFIPLAPSLTSTFGLSVRKGAFNGGIRARYLADRPANEDDSIIAEGYLITDLNLNYQFKRVGLGIVIENLFDQDWNETQFATESRLDFEAASVEEIHFTPGTPFFFKANIRYSF